MTTYQNIGIYEANEDNKKKLPHKRYYERIVKQSKKISQLIIRSWQDDKEAKIIRKIFLNFNNTDSDGEAYEKMKELLTGGRLDLCGKVFEEEEFEYYLIRIDWDSFKGSLTDNHQPSKHQKPPYFVLTLPYPPRPNDFNLNMQDKALQSWLNEEVDIDSEEEVTNPFPPVPYLPQTTS